MTLSSDVTAIVLLALGYPVALAMLVRLRLVLAERRVWWFVALEAATAGIAVGWLVDGRAVAAVVNGAAFAGFGIAWIVTGRRSRPSTANVR